MRNSILKNYLSRIKPILATALVAMCLCAFPQVGSAAQATSTERIDDVRVLIDISGSMKRTDPKNLRVPAMRLFTTLLPGGTNAGVWTFGQWVNMVVAHGPVDAAWKKTSMKNIEKINSSGLYTNIEEALKQSTTDWITDDKKYNRNLILLTDGLVDISKDPEANAHSRKAILEKYLPQLEKAGVKVHTIALSKESDQALLHQLSSATGGWFETIENTESLERLFLRMFEKVAQADSLPLNNNLVKIDKSIEEVTFLVFRNDSSETVSINTPSKKELNSESKLPNLTWYQDKRFDLVTIKNPEVGNWKINAALDPDNRAMVVTDLKLKNTELPNSVEAGVPITFNVHFEEDGKVITRKEFLSFIRVKINQVSKDNQEWSFKAKDNGKDADKEKRDGIYTIELNESLVEGEHDIEVDVNGTTFKRNIRQSIKVYGDPVDTVLTPLKNGIYLLSVVPYKTLIDSDAMRVVIEHRFPSGQTVENKVPRVSPAEWQTEIDSNNEHGKHEIVLHITGNRPDGSRIEKTLSTKEFLIAGEAVPEKSEEKTETNEMENHAEAEEVTETNWLMVSLRVLIFNILFGSIGFATYKFWPRIRDKIIPNPTKELVYE